jgi:hypothetical protein
VRRIEEKVHKAVAQAERKEATQCERDHFGAVRLHEHVRGANIHCRAAGAVDHKVASHRDRQVEHSVEEAQPPLRQRRNAVPDDTQQEENGVAEEHVGNAQHADAWEGPREELNHPI